MWIQYAYIWMHIMHTYMRKSIASACSVALPGALKNKTNKHVLFNDIASGSSIALPFFLPPRKGDLFIFTNIASGRCIALPGAFVLWPNDLFEVFTVAGGRLVPGCLGGGAPRECASKWVAAPPCKNTNSGSTFHWISDFVYNVVRFLVFSLLWDRKTYLER